MSIVELFFGWFTTPMIQMTAGQSLMASLEIIGILAIILLVWSKLR